MGAGLRARGMHSLVRRAAPSFSVKALVNGEFRQIKSDEFKGRYWVLFFYPLDLYMVSSRELIASGQHLCVSHGACGVQ